MEDIIAFLGSHFERFQGPAVTDGNAPIPNDVGAFLAPFSLKLSEEKGPNYLHVKENRLSIINGQKANNNEDNDDNLT